MTENPLVEMLMAAAEQARVAGFDSPYFACTECEQVYPHGHLGTCSKSQMRGGPKTRTCPACGFVAYTTGEEVAHMNASHPEIVAERLEAAGFRLIGGDWYDMLAGDD